MDLPPEMTSWRFVEAAIQKQFDIAERGSEAIPLRIQKAKINNSVAGGTTTIIRLPGNPVRIHQLIQKRIEFLVHFIEIVPAKRFRRRHKFLVFEFF